MATSGPAVDVDTSSAIVNEVIRKRDDRTEEDNGAAVPQSPVAEAAHNAGLVLHLPLHNSIFKAMKRCDNESGSHSQTPTDPDSSQSSMVPRQLDEAAVEAGYTLREPSADLKGVVEEPENDNDGSVSMSDRIMRKVETG